MRASPLAEHPLHGRGDARDRIAPVREALVVTRRVDRHRRVGLEDEHVAARVDPEVDPRVIETEQRGDSVQRGHRARPEMRGHVVQVRRLFGAVGIVVTHVGGEVVDLPRP